jgi:hypothetical protein
VEIIKDLLVNVLSSEENDLPFPSGIAADVPQGDDPAQMAQFLAELKKQLNRVLDKIGHDPQEIRERLRPQTLEQIEWLQWKFKEAQAELTRLRAELSKT